MPQPRRRITFRGKTKTIDDWAADTGIPIETIRSRLDQQGWTVERALTSPVDRRFSKKHKKLPVGVPRPCPRMLPHSSGQARASWWAAGKQRHRYFGKWGSKEAAQAYLQFQAEWLANAADKPDPGQVVHVAELVERFLSHAAVHYVKNGRPTSEYHVTCSALKTLNTLYGELPIKLFEPDHLRAYVAALVDKKLGRETVNKYHRRVVFAFGWGVTRGKLVPVDVYRTLKLVEYLEAGRTKAPDFKPKRSVPAADIEAALPHLHPRDEVRPLFVAAVRLQVASGLRPGELCAMKVEDLETTGHGDLWRYDPYFTQKNFHRGQRRVIWFGPRAQAILRPLLVGLSGQDHVFGYRRSKDGPRRPLTVNLYQNRVRAACKRAKVSAWHPHRLRHNRATEVHRKYEDDAAVKVALGDSSEVARQVYVDDPAEAAAKRIAKETG